MIHKLDKHQILEERLNDCFFQHKKLKKIVKSLEEIIEWIENYIEEQTGLELSDSDSDSDSDLPFCDLQIKAEKKGIKEQV